jgi:hypothetical protein
VIVGTFIGTAEQAFRWTPSTGIRAVQSLLAQAGVDTSGWQLTSANGVSADGTVIVGTGIDPDGNSQGWIAHIPVSIGGEPSTTHDFNGDGTSDIAWRDTVGNTAMWMMNGAQVSSSGGAGAVPTAWSIVGQRDFDGDGRYDCRGIG